VRRRDRSAARPSSANVPDFIQVVDDLARTASERWFLLEALKESAGDVFTRPTVPA
jgi:hypothetical protein